MNYSARIELGKPTKDGLCAIYIVITVARKKKRIPSNFSIPQTGFDHTKRKVKRSVPNYFEINKHIDDVFNKIEAAYFRLQKIGANVSADSLFAEMHRTPTDANILAYMQKEADRREKMDTVFSKGTIRQYKAKMGVIGAYDPTVTFESLSVKWLNDFETYLYLDRNNSKNTVAKTIKVLKVFVNHALKEGITENNPFLNFKIREDPHILRAELEHEEYNSLLQAYKDSVFQTMQHNALYWFLLACNTGVRYSDYDKFVRFDIENKRITFISQKTGKPFILRLSEHALNLYSNVETHYLISNQKMNKALGQIGEGMGIQKKLTTHVARRYFGKMCAQKGIPMHIIKELLGHSKITTTQLYMNPTEKQVDEEFRKVD